jgi:hypothetical protein
VIAHVVLFRPKASLPESQRAEFMRALVDALDNIPLIARAHVGRRVVMGRPYDALNALDFPFVALLEFNTRADLLAYLDHPAHAALGAQFYTAAESALAYDFEMLDSTRTAELLDG